GLKPFRALLEHRGVRFISAAMPRRSNRASDGKWLEAPLPASCAPIACRRPAAIFGLLDPGQIQRSSVVQQYARGPLRLPDHIRVVRLATFPLRLSPQDSAGIGQRGEGRLFRIWLLLSAAWIMAWTIYLVLFAVRTGSRGANDFVAIPVLLFGPPMALLVL